jgi:hypothetical protein
MGNMTEDADEIVAQRQKVTKVTWLHEMSMWLREPM